MGDVQMKNTWPNTSLAQLSEIWHLPSR